MKKTGWLYGRQAYRFLRPGDERKTPELVAASLRQLCYIGKAADHGKGLYSRPDLRGKEPDVWMLAAVDVMQDLAGGGLLDLAADRPPYKLCFLAQRDGEVASMAVLPVPPGGEAHTDFLLERPPEGVDRTVILLLAYGGQRDLLHPKYPCYFAVPESGGPARYRYYKGGEAP